MTSSTQRKSRTRSKPKVEQNSVEVFALPKALEMRNARALKTSLHDIFENQRSCKIDAGQVTKLSTGCAQVLISFLNTMRAAKRDASVINPSGAFSKKIHCLGLDPAIETYLEEA